MTAARKNLTPEPAIIDALMTSAGRTDPFPIYAQAHELGPVLAIADRIFLVCGYEAINHVLRDPGFGPAALTASTDRAEAQPENTLRSMNQSILWANPPDHPRIRSLMSRVFTPRRVAAQQPAIEATVELLLDRLASADGQSVDFMNQFAFALPVTVICQMLGVPTADHHRFRTLAADLTQILELSADKSDSADAAAHELAGYFTTLIQQRRAAPHDDLVSALVAAREADDGQLSDAELLTNLILLLVAGFETTTNLLGNGLAIWLQHPEIRRGIQSEQITTTGFIEEVLRYDSPVQMTTRQAYGDGCIVEGTPIPHSSELILLIGAANRDPRRYHDPDRFDPTRTDIKPLSFGAGPHICLGNGLARLEAAVAFPRLLARFPALTAASDAPAIRRDRLVLRGYETLPIHVTAHG
jgi:cytochrome P450